MSYKDLLGIMLCVLCFSPISAQNNLYIIPAHEFELEFPNDGSNYWSPAKKENEIISVNNFEISHQVSLKEYKEFLESNLKNENYKKLLPDSALFKPGSYQLYLKSAEYDNYPVAGISWDNAMEFCKWKTLKENQGDSIRKVYRLPTRNEWLAASKFLDDRKVNNDFNTCFADWTITIPIAGPTQNDPDLKPDYKYEEDEENNPLAKSKIIMGKSGFYQLAEMNLVGKKIYSFHTMPNLSFRYVVNYVEPINTNKYKKGSAIWKYYNSLYGDAYRILNTWGLYSKIECKHNTKIEYKFTDNINNKTEEFVEWSNIKSLGMAINGVNYGDWYYFDKEGKLNKHVYFNEKGKEIRVKDSEAICENVASPKINYLQFVDSIKSVAGKDTVEQSAKHIRCQVRKGKMDGAFILSDEGLDLKVCGMYKNNMRTGLWATWNKDKLLLLRNYKNSYEFENLYTAAPTNKVSRLMNTSGYLLQRNKEDYYDYFPVQEDLVFWTKDLWRELFPNENELLFENHKFINLLIKNVKEGVLKAYKPLVDTRFDKDLSEFGKEMSVNEINNSFGSSMPEIVKYNIKETAFIDYKRMSIEYRVIAIAPVAKDSTGKFRELFWIYLPDARKILANEKITDKNAPDYVTNYDDLFFFNYYGGSLYKESNVYQNRLLSDNVMGEDLKIEALKIEYSVLYFELDCIRYYLGY